ncbi:MAG: hypothetical protein GY710_08595 [Desulfobacteraceae bacterium]|nr:hypothetical protein [Desulfobacteraceae bacterium]
MLLKYTGQKKILHLTRIELEKEYLFEGKKPVEVIEGDGEYLLKEFPTAFVETEQAPAKGSKKGSKTKTGAKE